MQGLQLIFYRISGWKNALISVAVLLLVSWDINHNLGLMRKRNKRNIIYKTLYVLKKIVRKIHVGYVCLMYGIRVYFYLKAKYQAFIIFMRGIVTIDLVWFLKISQVYMDMCFCVCANVESCYRLLFLSTSEALKLSLEGHTCDNWSQKP